MLMVVHDFLSLVSSEKILCARMDTKYSVEQLVSCVFSASCVRYFVILRKHLDITTKTKKGIAVQNGISC